MIRPLHFAYNPQTAVNNSFQVPGEQAEVAGKALEEFDALVKKLRAHHIDVLVIEDSPEPHTPDAIFPNNWISFHEPGTLCLYPMFAVNRRQERKAGVIHTVEKRFDVQQKIDFTFYEKDGLFLEGTGSMVLDRDNRIAYAGLSPRTDADVLNDFCAKLKYQACVFHAYDEQGLLIYHTNVMMCVGDQFVVICLDSIRDEEERKAVVEKISSSGKEIIPIGLHQVHQFAGNMLQVENKEGKKYLVMSSAAYHSLSPDQIKSLSRFSEIIHAPLSTIESNGGGSARCMIAEIHLSQ